MKDHLIDEGGAPSHDARDLVKLCLDRLDEDKEHEVNDKVVRGLTFYELIGTLLKVRDEFAFQDEVDARRLSKREE